jgi:CheY-like chemotaxis protein
LGAAVVVRVLVRSAAESIECRARVVGTATALTSGERAGVEVEFLSDEGGRLASLLQRVDAVRSVPLEGCRVLVVEDSDLTAEMFAHGIRKFFRNEGVEVVVDRASDGQRGWDLLRKGHYDIALIDHYMPVLPGAELLAKVRRDARLDSLTVVGMSVGGADVRDSMLEAGADLFLSKPVVLKELLETLRWLAHTQPPTTRRQG